MRRFKFTDGDGDTVVLTHYPDGRPILRCQNSTESARVELSRDSCRDLAAALLDGLDEPEQPAPSEKSKDDWLAYLWRGIEAGLKPDEAAKAADMSVRGRVEVGEPTTNAGRHDITIRSVYGVQRGCYTLLSAERDYDGAALFQVYDESGKHLGETWISSSSWADLIRLQPKPSNV